MIHSRTVRIPIPKRRNTHCKVEVNGDDVTGRVIESLWVLPTTDGVGTFSLSLSNARGQLSDLYKKGDTVSFYADNSDSTTLQFIGRIDYTKDDISDSGQYLNIDGRHKSFLLTEHLVCHSAIDTETSQILKDIIDKLPSSYGFTYSNVNTGSATLNVEWNYKPFWDCVKEISNRAGFDCYVDNDLDFHYFEENSIANNDNAIVEGQNFLSCKDYGTNDYYEKTRVVAVGKDSAGLDIIYTAISPDEGEEIREFFVKDFSANTYEKVKDLAESKLAEVTNKNPQSDILSFGLESINPGDNIWIIIPRQKIAGQYKIVKIMHKFGMKSGGWRTELIMEEEEASTSGNIKKLDQKTQQVSGAQNVHKLDYSYNFGFDSDVGTHEDTEIVRGFLRTKGDAEKGTWISPVTELSENISNFEFRAVGSNISDVDYLVSTTNGSIWQPVSDLNAYKAFSPVGKNLRIKVILNSSFSQVDSIALLYS